MAPKRKRNGKGQGIRKRMTRSTAQSPAIVKKEEQQEMEETEEDVEDPEQEYEEVLDKAKTLVVAVKKTSISCKECNKKFRFNVSFKQHLLNEHSKLPTSVQCDQCPVRCPNRTELKEHIKKIHERELYECPQCKKTFVRHAHVLRHMAQMGCNGSRTFLYPCEICGAKFSRKDNLMVHLRMQHILRKKYACKQCNFSTSTFSKLCVHRNKNHLDHKLTYECDHCGRVVTSRPAMVKHLEIHGEKKFACDVCGYSTFTLEVMRRHVLTHVEEKPYKCSQCPVSFIQRAQLQRHTAAKHHDNTCLVCNTECRSKEDLVAHNRAKHGSTELDPSYRCSVKSCDQYNMHFKSAKAYKTHMNSHDDERPYACEVCGKTYRNVLDMKRHVTSHTLERPRRCMYCVQPRAYVRGIQLVRHVRKTHPAAFHEHLLHVRQVLADGTTNKFTQARVKQSELESILNVLDAEADRILEGYGEGVLYGGMQETGPDAIEVEIGPTPLKKESNPLMSEEELAENLNKLLVQLIDKELLVCFGWPTETVDTVLEKVIEHCGARPADRDMWTRVQRLRENAKHLFLHVIEDKNITRMLDSHTIDQIVKHVLAQVSEGDADEQGAEE
ncbi:hypothetical protein O0L34_g943 [Tuta absoluta]|nr:hypothetical protein O0L34_g943 [Tuta absoluta]